MQSSSEQPLVEDERYVTTLITAAKENNDAHARVPFSARDEENDSDYMDFSALLAGMKILSRLENTGLGFLAKQQKL